MKYMHIGTFDRQQEHSYERNVSKISGVNSIYLQFYMHLPNSRTYKPYTLLSMQ